MDTKLKSTNLKVKKYIIYLLIVILSSIILLSFEEIKNNSMYINTENAYLINLQSDINDYANNTLDLVTYYIDEAYIKNKDNITENDKEICRDEINEKIEEEFQEYKEKNYSQENYYNLSYEEQQKLDNEERKKIEEKYNFTEEQFEDYIIERKLNSYKTLKNDLASYKNIKYAAYDSENNKLISGHTPYNEGVLNSSKYLIKIDIASNGNEVYTRYVNGKQIREDNRTHRNSFFNNWNYTTNYESTVNIENTYLGDEKEKKNIILYVWVPSEIVAGDYIYNNVISIEQNLNRFKYSLITLGISAVALAVIVSVVIRRSKKDKENKVDKIIEKLKVYPVEYKIIALLTSLIIWNLTIYTSYYGGYATYYVSLNINNIIWTTISFCIWYLLLRILYLDFKEGTLFKNSITPKLHKRIVKEMEKGSIFRSIFITMMVYVAIGLMLLVIAIITNGMLFPICLIVGIIMTIGLFILAIIKLSYLNKIMIGARDAVEGRLTYKIDEKGIGLFRELAHNINNMKDGLRVSIENEMKSERMKTELITNVSHDLKTPLTSIINYIDLLKREELETESARDYVNILDNKAQRLKVLIEDLFEASKAASGAMELNIEKIDIIQLLMQALGENDERLNERNLAVKNNIPPTKIFVNADGKRLYRVFENLIINISKYSMENTRVYIDMIKAEDEVKIIMKNISAYELSFDENEITERFKRGDEARTTDGSGLGLAISKSIISLHGGKFDIEIDGDLFKAIITLKL